MWSSDLSRGKLKTGGASDRHESPPKKWQCAINFSTTEMTTVACKLLPKNQFRTSIQSLCDMEQDFLQKKEMNSMMRFIIDTM
jgi:hypothetical protein